MTNWATWRCAGPRLPLNGYPCNKILAEVVPVPGMQVRVRCPKCYTYTLMQTDKFRNMPMRELAVLKCGGHDRNGMPCTVQLARLDLPPGGAVRIKCDYCGCLTEMHGAERVPLAAPVITSVAAYASVGSVGR